MQTEGISHKTRLLNQVRRIGLKPPVELALVWLAQITGSGRVVQKFAPNNYQYPQNTLRRCERDGIKYILDISDFMQYCLYFRVEIEPRDVLYKLVKDGTTVIDVGTNIGETLLNFARINQTGVNIGFEPIPAIFSKAKLNIQLNSFENIVLENVGLSSADDTLSFQVPNEHNSGGIFLVKHSDDNIERVRVMKLDDYVGRENLKEISLIKIDVEGFEMNVLRGAKETIRKFRPALFVEINDGFLRREGSSAKEVFAFLEDLGYEIRYAQSGLIAGRDGDFSNKHFDVVCVNSN
jgi:FkbM family methyltransferase